ncbi:MAG TPA: hypothetical protein VHB68_20585 [Steroidobacteraceae bacterium]|nr:hypothetical protein [Steroidobacteraceae bacterium]
MEFRKDTLPIMFVRLRLNAGGDSSCLPPPAPTHVPDGRTAEEAEMITAMFRFRKYNRDVESYLKRLEQAARARRISPPIHTQMHNDMVDTLRRVVEQFNFQVRTYKAREALGRRSARAQRH